MRIFIGYGYNDRDRWIEDLVFPLLTAFGCDLVHGNLCTEALCLTKPSKLSEIPML